MLKIETTGLRELARNAKKLGDTGVTNGLKDASFRSAQIVVNRGRVIAAATGRPASVIAAESLRASKSAGKAAVIFGRNNVPWLVGNNFRGEGPESNHVTHVAT